MVSLPFSKNGRPVTESLNANGNQVMIELRGVDKLYRTAVGDYPALRGVELQINAGEFVSVIGKSGSGKTTLINMITGIDRPTAGEVWVNGTPVHEMSEGRMARWRGKNLGIVFQFFQLLPMISVVENVMLPMDFCRTYPLRQREQRALHLLDLVGLVDHAYKVPSALSGGQQQRAAIARALANDPPIVIADEPTGNLDSKTAEAVFELFDSLVAQGKTIIIVTHDSSLAKRTQRTALITDGEIVNEYVAQALPTLTHDQLLEATRKLKPRHCEAGEVILQQGGEGEHFCVVSKGSVEIVLQRPNATDVVVTTLGPGKYFGEIELFHRRANSATVRVSREGPAEILMLDFETLNELLGRAEGTREALMRAAEKHHQQNLDLREKHA